MSKKKKKAKRTSYGDGLVYYRCKKNGELVFSVPYYKGGISAHIEVHGSWEEIGDRVVLTITRTAYQCSDNMYQPTKDN